MASPATGRREYDAANRVDLFTWKFPGAPFRVETPLGLIARLQAKIAATVDVELGGVLIGRSRPEQATVEIHDCICVPGSAQTDGRYTLNLQELDSLRQANPVIGYFRTHSKGALWLRNDEIDLVRTQFRSPTNIVLLIRTSGLPNTAGFFFWDRDVFSDISIMDFPFDAAFLRLWGT